MTMRVAATFGTKTSEKRIVPYECALREVGIEPVRNPESLTSLDGLLLAGGSDINPKHYGHSNKGSEQVDDARDELELKLLREALAADVPVFAICRGLQMLNVVRGGTLVQHLGLPVHSRKPGDAENGRHPAAHCVAVEAGTRLAEIIGAGPHEVNSRHHQAVERLGEGLVISARSEDGVVEGLEVLGAAFAVAVQWHPEDRILVSGDDRKLFEAFAAAVAQ
jgi:putative glutamine amidotransferase